MPYFRQIVNYSQTHSHNVIVYELNACRCCCCSYPDGWCATWTIRKANDWMFMFWRKNQNSNSICELRCLNSVLEWDSWKFQFEMGDWVCRMANLRPPSHTQPFPLNGNTYCNLIRRHHRHSRPSCHICNAAVCNRSYWTRIDRNWSDRHHIPEVLQKSERKLIRKCFTLIHSMAFISPWN